MVSKSNAETRRVHKEPGEVKEDHRGQEMEVSGEERFSQCRSSTPGGRLRTSESHDDLLGTGRTKQKRWQHRGRTGPPPCVERNGEIRVQTEPGSTSAGPGAKCSCETDQPVAAGCETQAAPAKVAGILHHNSPAKI